MLILPMRSQEPSPNRQSKGSCTPSLSETPREISPNASELRKQVAGAMLSVSTRPPPPKRPKLSLQTSISSQQASPRLGGNLGLSACTESPMFRNAHVNALDAPPPTPTSAIQPQVHFPSPSSTTFSTSSATSPFSNPAPYTLPLGTHSILHNSPLPRRHISATSARASKRMFPPIKKVAFQDKLVQIIPSPAVERSSSDTEGEVEEQEAGADGERLSLTEDEHQKRRELIEAEDGHSKPIHGRRKRHREWVWRPVEGDILVYHDIGSREHKLRNEVEEDILELADRRGSPLCLGETLHSG